MTHAAHERLFAAGTAAADFTHRAADQRTATARTEESLQPNRARGLVVDRLATVARRHARHRADQQWRGQPIGPHVIAFFYDQPTAADLTRIRVATRMFLDGPDVEDLPTVLGHLHERALDYLVREGLDPRAQLSNRVEPMHVDARFLGIGVTTVDSDTAQANAAFRGLAQLTDGTQLLLRSAGGAQPLDTRSSHTLDLDTGHTRLWRWVGPSFLHADPELRPTADALTQLCEVVDAAQHTRLPTRRRRSLRALR